MSENEKENKENNRGQKYSICYTESITQGAFLLYNQLTNLDNRKLCCTHYQILYKVVKWFLTLSFTLFYTCLDQLLVAEEKLDFAFAYRF